MSGRITVFCGGGFLCADACPDDVFVREDFTDEELELYDAALKFCEREITPSVINSIEGKNLNLLKELVQKAGDADILRVEIPEEYGGFGGNLAVSALIFEAMGRCGSASFASTIGGHSGIGTWPILYFGTEEQRRKYIPGIASGKFVASYALTEAGSGSDALAARCKAEPSKCGRYYKVNGEKVFITNAGIADIFTVLVKINGQNTCLLIEAGTPGVSVGSEEDKLGIRGSSTRSVIFEDALVPVENQLGEIGRGHKIVLNTLNLGRFKLGVGAVGGIKNVLALAIDYASKREQFGKPISEFDAIQAKIAQMAISAWVGESVVYRTAGLLAAALESMEPPKAIEEYSAESAMTKVLLSEMYWSVCDEMVQIFGGYGLMEDYPAARALRDARVYRIIEGTNEINRMLAVGTMLKRAVAGKLPLFGQVSEHASEPAFVNRAILLACKKTANLLLKEAAQKYMAALEHEQQIVLELADMLIQVFAMESALLRLEKMAASGKPVEFETAMVDVYMHESQRNIAMSADRVLSALVGLEGKKEMMMPILGSLFSKSTNEIVMRRGIAAAAMKKFSR